MLLCRTMEANLFSQTVSVPHPLDVSRQKLHQTSKGISSVYRVTRVRVDYMSWSLLPHILKRKNEHHRALDEDQVIDHLALLSLYLSSTQDSHIPLLLTLTLSLNHMGFLRINVISYWFTHKKKMELILSMTNKER